MSMIFCVVNLKKKKEKGDYMSINYKMLSSILLKKREFMKLSIEELSVLSKVSKKEINKLENSNAGNINLSNLKKICEVLKIDFESLLSIIKIPNKMFEVTAMRTNRIIFKVQARNEEEAINVIENFVFRFGLFDLKDLKNATQLYEFNALDISESTHNIFAKP